ncbi:MAG: CpaF family protein [Candidatus Omnitrophota bacterium]
MKKDIKNKIRRYLFSKNLNLVSAKEEGEAEFKNTISRLIDEFIHKEHLDLPEKDKSKIANEMFSEFTGFGPIEEALKDPKITEIMINGIDRVYVERLNKTELTDITFDDETQLMSLIYKILSPTRRRVDESYAYTEVSLKDGSRVNIVIPPLALNGPVLTIRKFLKGIKSVEDLINFGTLDRRIGDLLIAAIKSKIDIIFSGATGAGKTTTLNVLSSYIPNDERIVTIEDTAELCLSQDHVVRLEARQANIEGRGEVTIRELFKNSLRMRPDRIIMGEIRGAEALDMLQAICSGHKGSLAVIHANSPQDVIYRLETMIVSSGIPISLEAIHRQIGSVINFIVQQEQLMDGSRKITRVTQVNGIKDNQAVLEDIFVYDIEGINEDGSVRGSWKATGIIPVCYPLFKKSGIDLSVEIFNKG